MGVFITFPVSGFLFIPPLLFLCPDRNYMSFSILFLFFSSFIHRQNAQDPFIWKFAFFDKIWYNLFIKYQTREVLLYV